MATLTRRRTKRPCTFMDLIQAAVARHTTLANVALDDLFTGATTSRISVLQLELGIARLRADLFRAYYLNDPARMNAYDAILRLDNVLDGFRVLLDGPHCSGRGFMQTAKQRARTGVAL